MWWLNDEDEAFARGHDLVGNATTILQIHDNYSQLCSVWHRSASAGSQLSLLLPAAHSPPLTRTLTRKEALHAHPAAAQRGGDSFHLGCMRLAEGGKFLTGFNIYCRF